MGLADYVRISMIVDVDIRRDELIRLLIGELASEGGLAAADVAALESAVQQRERLGSTGIGCGVAWPHAVSDRIREPVAALAVLRRPIEFASLDGEPVDLVLLQLTPPLQPGVHLGSPIVPHAVRLLQCFSQEEFRRAVRLADSAAAIRQVFERAESGGFDAEA